MKINKEIGVLEIDGIEHSLSQCVVVLENGKRGVILNYGIRPSHIIFESYSKPIKVYNEDGTIGTSGYNIVSVYRLGGIDDYTKVFKKSFKLEDYKKLV